MSESVQVPERAKQTETAPSQWVWVDRAVWTERMLAALGNGVKGSKWFRWPNASFAQLGLFTMTQARI
jgi:RNA-directed DNA polymerase